MQANITIMSKMSEEEKQHIEALLTCCRRQAAEYDYDKQGWEDQNKAVHEEEERQRRMKESGQQVKPELGESSREGTMKSTLKVKSSKGKDIVVVKIETNKQSQTKSQDWEEKMKDESVGRVDESPTEEEEEQYDAESFDPPVEYEDPMFMLMEGKELEEEYNEMTLEQEEEIIAQLTPQERAEHQEMTEFNQVQASVTKRGMKIRLKMIQERTKQKAPGLPPDILQRIIKEEPDVTKRDIGQISEVKKQTILHKQE